MGESDHCTVWGCFNDCRFPQKIVIKEHICACDRCKHTFAFGDAKRVSLASGQSLLTGRLLTKLGARNLFSELGNQEKCFPITFNLGS